MVWNKAAKIEVAMICWSIWKNRNKLVWKAKILVLVGVVSLANQTLLIGVMLQKSLVFLPGLGS